MSSNEKKVESPVIFNNFLSDRMDFLDNATMEYCKIISGNDSIEWDAGIMGEILEFVCDTLNLHGIDTCYPYYEEDDKPCIEGEECSCKNCPLK